MTVSDGELSFRDVNHTHKNYSSIYTLYNLGVINGKNKYVFSPDETIRMDEAVKILMTALGYQPVAESKGGFPGGYYAVAKSAELLAGVEAGSDLPITHAQVLKLIYNALFVEVIDQPVFSDELVIQKNGKNLLELVYGVEEMTGMVEETFNASFKGEGSLTENQVRINGVVYEFSQSGLDNKIGFVVRYYVMDRSPQIDEIIHYELDINNNFVTIDAENIKSQTNLKEFVYYEGSREKMVKISNVAEFIYNGMGKTDCIAENLIPKLGNVTLNDINRDNVADVVIIRDLRLIVVDNILDSENNLLIVGVNGERISIDKRANECNIKVYKNGELMTISDIAKNNVLFMQDSGVIGGKRLFEFTVSDKTVSGILNGIKKDEITVDGTKYEVSPSYNPMKVQKFIGSGVMAFLAPDGKVAYIKESSDGGKAYAYLYSAANTGIDNFSDDIQIRLLLADNSYKIYSLADKVKCNGGKYTDKEIYNMLAPGKKTTQQLVKFKINNVEEIVELDTAVVVADDTEEQKLCKENVFRKSYSKSNRFWVKRSNSMLCGPSPSSWVDFVVNGNTVVLVRPDEDNPDEDSVYFTDFAYFTDWNKYICEGYDLSADNFIGAMVVYENLASAIIKNDQNFLVVDEICEIYENEETVPALAVYERGVHKTVPVTDRSVLQKDGVELKRGDIIRVFYDNKGRISGLENKPLRFSVTDNIKKYYTDSTSYVSDNQADLNLDAYTYYAMIIGEVVDINGNMLKVRVKDTDDGKPAYIKANIYTTQPYVKYSKVRGEYVLTEAKREDLSIGDIVVQRTYHTTPHDCVIYKLD